MSREKMAVKATVGEEGAKLIKPFSFFHMQSLPIRALCD